MDELKTLKIKTTLNDGNKTNLYLNFLPLPKYSRYKEEVTKTLTFGTENKSKPLPDTFDYKQEIHNLLKQLKYGEYIFKSLYSDNHYQFYNEFGQHEKYIIDVTRIKFKIYADYKITNPAPTEYINTSKFKPNIVIDYPKDYKRSNYSPGVYYNTQGGFTPHQMNKMNYTMIESFKDDYSFDLAFADAIFDVNDFNFDTNTFTGKNQNQILWYIELNYHTKPNSRNNELVIKVGEEYYPGYQLQEGLNEFFGSQPPQTNTFTIRTKLEGYPGFLLPESLPCKIYEGQSFIKDVVLLKANRYSTQEELESTKKYTAKLDTTKIPKKFLERTKIQPPTITDEGWTYQLNLKCTNSDPYPGGGSEGGGGEGGLTPGGSGTIDGVPIPLPPAFGLTDTGLVTLFSPTRSQIHALGQALWTPTFFQKISKMFADPMDAILGLNLLPLKVASGTAKEIVVGNVGTGVHCNVCGQQYMFFSVGTINIPKKYDSYLDYAPFTKVEIFLPFIGFRTLNTDEVMDTTITVTYQVDVLTGQCNATLFNNKGLMFACFSGNCATTIPLSGRDFTGVFRSAITVATAVGLGVATGGASLLEGGAGSVASSVSSMKPSIQRSGSVSGATAMLTTRTPYVLVERPNACIPKNQNVIEGYPSFVTKQLSECRGYTSVQSVELEGLSNATEEEKTEVVSILKGGVYL